MTDPYYILGVPTTADDEAVRAAYLEAIRACPPESDPQRFEQVRTAYEIISTVRGRLSYALFDKTAPTGADVLNAISADCQPRRPDVRLLRRVLGVK